MEHLLPQEWFEKLPTLLLLCAMAVAVLMLLKGANWLVGGAVRLASALRVPPIIIGATIVSLGTTSPEAAVSVTAAWEGHPGLALGNAVGSIVADTGLIFGLCCMLRALPIDKFIFNRHGWLQFAAGLLLTVVCTLAYFFEPSGSIPRWVGLAMLVLLLGYIGTSVVWARRHERLPVVAPHLVRAPAGPAGRVSLLSNSWLLLAGLALVLLGSRVTVASATVLCIRWGVPQEVVAATLVAFGTSLPELATALAAIARGYPQLLIGNIIGADILNVLFVAGASAAASPLYVPRLFLQLHLPAMMLILLLFRIFGLVGKRSFSRWMGLPLLACYLAYIVLQYLLS